MPTYEQTQEALDQLINALPPGIFRNLNGGVALREAPVYDHNGLLILGHYHVEPRGLGRYITIHYGSLAIAYGHLSPDRFCEKLKDTLHHELTHHLEHLAGDRSLEIQDEQQIKRILSGNY